MTRNAQRHSHRMSDDDAMSLDLSGYELCWPTALFASEGERVLRSDNSAWQERAKWLMTEALVGTTAVADFEEVSNAASVYDDPWAPQPRLKGPTQRTGSPSWSTVLRSFGTPLLPARIGRSATAEDPRPMGACHGTRSGTSRE